MCVALACVRAIGAVPGLWSVEVLALYVKAVRSSAFALVGHMCRMNIFHDNGTYNWPVALRKPLTPISHTIALDLYSFSNAIV